MRQINYLFHLEPFSNFIDYNIFSHKATNKLIDGEPEIKAKTIHHEAPLIEIKVEKIGSKEHLNETAHLIRFH